MKTDILFVNSSTAESEHLKNFYSLHDEIGRTINNLRKWSDNQSGGSIAVPDAYRAISSWIGQQQDNPNSLYSCR